MNPSQTPTILSRRFPAKRIFITGAGSGLGRAMSLEFASAGWRIGIADISAGRLAAAGDVASEPFVTGAVDVTPVADWRWIVDINLLGVVWGCRAALPLMRRQNSGLILNVASSAGFAAAPQMSAYNVTKAGVISLSETLASELGGTGIQVSCAMPGFFRTHLLDTMRTPADECAMAHQLMDHSGHDPAEAARAILGAVAAGDLYIVWPREYRLLRRLKRFFPLWFRKRVQRFRDAQISKAARRPPG